ILLILFVLAVIGGTWYLYTEAQATKEPTRPEGITTALVTRGPIEAAISATGSVAAERTRPLSFTTGGTVAQVLAAEGDVVVADQVLARLETTDLELAVRQAEAALAVSEAQLARAKVKPTEAEIASAEAVRKSAEAQLADARRGATDRDKELAKLAIDQAKNSLWAAQANRDSVKGTRFAPDSQKDQAEAAVLNAEVAVTSAEVRYQQLLEPPRTVGIRAAEAQIAQATSALERLRSQPSAEDLALTEAQVAQARLGVEVAQRRLRDAVLRAPMAGELATWGLHVRDAVTPATPAGTLVDVSRHHVTVGIDEADIGRIAVGQEARITADAFPDDPLQGAVAKIDLVGTNVQGIVSYSVRVDLEPTALPVRPLMTVAVDLVVERKDDVVLVPNRAIRRDKDGKYVEIIESNLLKKVYIETGVADGDSAEVLKGLDVGQEVVVGRPRESIFTGGPFGGG
ncbi:MAG: HlyD family efflux transporter periplasmic adaptor subunit, partial [Chloroflexota bacterium]